MELHILGDPVDRGGKVQLIYLDKGTGAVPLIEGQLKGLLGDVGVSAEISTSANPPPARGSAAREGEVMVSIKAKAAAAERPRFHRCNIAFCSSRENGVFPAPDREAGRNRRPALGRRT